MALNSHRPKTVAYAPDGIPINTTNEGVGRASDAHVTNVTIEQSTGANTNSKNIQAGFVDENGHVQPPLVDSITRKIQIDISDPLISNSYLRRLEELNLLQSSLNALNEILVAERYSSNRAGFEIR